MKKRHLLRLKSVIFLVSVETMQLVIVIIIGLVTRGGCKVICNGGLTEFPEISAISPTPETVVTLT